jgi:preprotein translocase subunit Sec63
MSSTLNAEVQKILKSSNLYEILGISENFDPDELKLKYRKVILVAGNEISPR